MLARFTHVNWRMADFTALNFTQMISPAGAGAPTVNGGQGGLLSTNPLASSGLFGGDLLAGVNSPPTDIFTLLLSQNNALPKQEKFTPLGKNLPAQATAKATLEEKKSDNSLDALQAALAGLAIQQSAAAPTPVPTPTPAAISVLTPTPTLEQQLPVQAEIISGAQSDDTLVGGTQSLVQNAPQVVPQISDVLVADNAPVVASQVPQAATSVIANFKPQSEAIAAYQLLQNKNSLLGQAQNLWNKTNAAQQNIAQNQAQQLQDNKVASAAQNMQVLQNKTFSAYRATTALSQPEVGSKLNISDSEAAKNAALVPVPTTAPAPAKTAVASKPVIDDQKAPTTTVVTKLATPKDSGSDAIEQALARMKNLAANASQPKAEDAKTAITEVVANAVPVAQPAIAKPAQTASDSDNKKTAEKSDAALPNSPLNTVTPQAVSQISQQQNHQQFSQKKPGGETIDVVKLTAEKVETNDAQLTPSTPHKVVPTTTGAQDFADQLSKTIGSPAEQVAMKIAHLPSGKQNITVQLDPADLGKVDVKLTWGNDGHAHISIAAEHKDTLEMLKGDMGALQRSLADSGIKTDSSSLQFSLRGQDGFAGQFAQGNQQQKNDGGQALQQSSNSDLKQTIESASLAARYVNLNNLVDLHV